MGEGQKIMMNEWWVYFGSFWKFLVVFGFDYVDNFMGILDLYLIICDCEDVI